MSLDIYIQKIDRYLNKNEGQALVVDVENAADQVALITHYSVGSNRVVAAKDFCKTDELPSLDAILELAATATGTVFITGLSTFLKLEGVQRLCKVLHQLLSMAVVGHVIVVTFQCRSHLVVRDPRLERRIVLIDGDEQVVPKIIMVPPSLPIPSGAASVNGIENLAAIVEDVAPHIIYLLTEKGKHGFPHSLLPLQYVSNAFEALCLKDHATNSLGQGCGTEEQWSYALTLFTKKDSWGDVVDDVFGNQDMLEHVFPSFASFNTNKKWLYFVALKLYGVKKNWCLQTASTKAAELGSFIKQLFFSLLEDKSTEDKDFWDCYEVRKAVTRQLSDYGAVVNEYCSSVFAKGGDALCYMTDNTEKEKEAIFRYLDQYGLGVERSKLLECLKKVYPALYEYLLPYHFKNEILDKYFQEYKYQKVINKILPAFEDEVNAQAVKREYNLFLEPRTAIVERLDRKRSQLYFVDAMGVEYLSYIVGLCKKLGLQVKVTVCRAELPSITSCNKEFIELFANEGIPVTSIKDIDEIKHHGKYDYDYYKNSKLPIYLIKELETIKELLTRINNNLQMKTMDKAFIIADHGASRLAVLYDTENVWEMGEKGEHSGRCCLKSDLDEKPDFATDAGDFWALANYDRFKGGRKANVEVHGGATLEELCVPVIELSILDKALRVHLLSADSDKVDFNKIVEVEISYRKKAALKLFATAPLQEASVVINGTYYNAVPVGGNFYRVDIPDITKTGTYYADVLAGDTLLAEKLPFVVRRKGMQERNLF